MAESLSGNIKLAIKLMYICPTAQHTYGITHAPISIMLTEVGFIYAQRVGRPVGFSTVFLDFCRDVSPLTQTNIVLEPGCVGPKTVLTYYQILSTYILIRDL